MSVQTQTQKFSTIGEIVKGAKNYLHHCKLLAQMTLCAKPMARIGRKSFLIIQKPQNGRQMWLLRGVDKPVHSRSISEIYESGSGKR